MKYLARPPIERFQTILDRLGSSKCPVHARRLAADMEVCTKTVRRDVEFLRDRLQFPVEGGQQGYYMRPPCPEQAPDIENRLAWLTEKAIASVTDAAPERPAEPHPRCVEVEQRLTTLEETVHRLLTALSKCGHSFYRGNLPGRAKR